MAVSRPVQTGYSTRLGTQYTMVAAPSSPSRQRTSTFSPSQSAFAGGGSRRVTQPPAGQEYYRNPFNGKIELRKKESAQPAEGDTSMFKDLMAKMEASSEGARTANIARRDEISSMYDDIISGIQAPTGKEDEAFRASTERQMEATKKKDVGAGAQRLISSGLYGTEQAGSLEQKWEADVGVGQRMKMEDIISQRGEERQQRYGERVRETKLGKAGFLERIEEPGVDYGLLAQLAMQIGNR